VKIDDCIIGDNVTIGAGAELSHCFIFHNTEVPAGVSKSRHYLSSAISEPINLP
jgi:mannose-1-phosphate guanylyltransferase